MPITVAQVGSFMCLHRELRQSERVTDVWTFDNLCRTAYEESLAGQEACIHLYPDSESEGPKETPRASVSFRVLLYEKYLTRGGKL
ncbi:hypothetical protein NDU88_006751 [Pleurodeles waltl]|uniref:Uncharacterized protein n=1 Tax=Pleurodeles waltl TaxID=8319 RepID=A0AAV7UN29_PLEWA|nr:hypothetical protein NDU88_006751 [Pleurodeles waltl]